MQIDLSRYRVKLAETEAEREGAQRLRYRVFVEEMGAHATPEEAAARREWDDFDPCFDHLILLSLSRPIADPLDRVVGVYRLMRGEVALAGPGFYGAGEYDLAAIAGSGRPCVELGRSCVAREHRGGPAMHLLWNGLASYVLERGIELLFGVASFHGTDPAPLRRGARLSPPRAPGAADLRVRAQAGALPRHEPDAARGRSTRRGRCRPIPPLIKAYLRLGGFVGDGAFVDRDFNTIDVCVVMDTVPDDRALPALLPAHPGAPGVRAGWNEAEPPALPPLTCGERLRLALRALWSVAVLAVLFAVFLRAPGLDILAARLAGRSVSALGPAVVRLWAAQALPTLGLGYVRRGAAHGPGRGVRREPFELARHRGAAAGGGALPRLQGRGAGLAGDRPHRPRHRHHVHRPPPRRGQAPGGASSSRASPAATAWRSSPRGRAPTASGCCRSSRRSSASSSPPSSRAASPCSR